MLARLELSVRAGSRAEELAGRLGGLVDVLDVWRTYPAWGQAHGMARVRPGSLDSMDRELIYDVGVHVGEDTGYYLHKRFRVVGVEANPAMYDSLQEKFAEPIRLGRLVLLNVGIADQPGELDFYVCDEVSEWSSFDRSIAGRGGARHHAVKVEARQFSSVLAEHGTPWYCKVDIEGHDRLCLEGLQPSEDPPQYVSVEMNHESADIDIQLLVGLGYTRFKIISQTSRSQPLPIVATFSGLLPNALSKGLRGLDREIRGKRRDGTWTYPRGSSGPFGDDTPGPWRDSSAAVELWRHLRRVEERRRPGGGNDWYDIHATVAS